MAKNRRAEADSRHGLVGHPAAHQPEVLQAPLWTALGNRQRAPLASLPDTGVPLVIEAALSSAFVDFPENAYGTRSSTVLLAGAMTMATACGAGTCSWKNEHMYAQKRTPKPRPMHPGALPAVRWPAATGRPGSRRVFRAWADRPPGFSAGRRPSGCEVRPSGQPGRMPAPWHHPFSVPRRDRPV